MRWPFRNPHCLTAGMHDIQRGMSQFHSALDWVNFSPQPIDERLRVVHQGSPAVERGETSGVVPVLPFGCADSRQALVWLLRDLRATSLDEELPPLDLLVPCMEPRRYVAEFWETYKGVKTGEQTLVMPDEDALVIEGQPYARLALPSFGRDLAIVIKPDCAA